MTKKLLHNIQVTSCGGVGTTSLCRHLASLGCHLPPGNDWGVSKHQRFPPGCDVVPAGFRGIYLFGDPRNSVVSLFRRNIQFRHFRRIFEREPDEAVIDALGSLDAYVSFGRDLYRMEEHLENWRLRAEFPVLFIRQEVLSASWKSIAIFLGLQDSTPALPAQVRASDWRLLPRHIQEGLTTTHARLIEIVESLPPIFSLNNP